MRKPLLLAGLAGLACLVLVQPARADEDLIVLKEGQGREVVEQNCAACHSLDYIVMNSPILDQAKWEATVKKMIGTYGGAAMTGVPTMLVAMMEHPGFAATDMSHLQGICSGGSTVPAALVRRFEDQLRAPFTIVFGQTECSPVASMTRPDDSVEDKAGTIGTPMPHVEVKIIDPASGETLPVGQVGEYCTRGYHVMHGYYENAPATAAAIDAGGWLHTGDLGEFTDSGRLRIVGRKKDMFIVGGFNAYPAEIEGYLLEHPAVAQVAVIGTPDERMGQVGKAFVVPAADAAPITEAELISWSRERMAGYKAPRTVVFLEALPLGATGKVQKDLLR